MSSDDRELIDHYARVVRRIEDLILDGVRSRMPRVLRPAAVAPVLHPYAVGEIAELLAEAHEIAERVRREPAR